VPIDRSDESSKVRAGATIASLSTQISGLGTGGPKPTGSIVTIAGKDAYFILLQHQLDCNFNKLHPTEAKLSSPLDLLLDLAMWSYSTDKRAAGHYIAAALDPLIVAAMTSARKALQDPKTAESQHLSLTLQTAFRRARESRVSPTTTDLEQVLCIHGSRIRHILASFDKWIKSRQERLTAGQAAAYHLLAKTYRSVTASSSVARESGLRPLSRKTMTSFRPKLDTILESADAKAQKTRIRRRQAPPKVIVASLMDSYMRKPGKS
jgi:hypothetical protein